ncbi:MAG: ACT domain-containing protein, partial [Pseudanabaenaceae cyanobacterium]
ILGVVTMGSNRTITIHNRECHNLHQVPAERLIHVEWNRGKDAERPMTHPIDIRVESIDRVGVLKDILTKLSDNKVNVRAANVKTKAGHSATIELNIDIVDRHQYEKICQQIMKMCDTVSVCRVLHDN